jgi:dienelactone hydrolase
MRLWEIVLVWVCVFAVVWPALEGRRLWRGVTATLLAAAALFQLIAEGFRWQLWGLYALAAGMAIGDLLASERQLESYRRIRRVVLGLVGVLLVVAPAWALPVVELPPPTGPYQVATTSFEIRSEDRLEDYGPDPGEFRRVMVQVWYPGVVPEEAEPLSPWLADLEVVGSALSQTLGFPGFFLDYTRYTPSNSFEWAEPFQGRIPVVLYSHGWRLFRNAAVHQMESLASHGFVVVAVDHTHGAVATVFPDGSIAHLDPQALPDSEEVEEEVFEEAAMSLLETYSEDLRMVIDGLERGVSGPFGSLAAIADLNRVGIYGHSLGGGAAVRTCLLEPICKAVGSLDGWVEPISSAELSSELNVPSMFIRSDPWRELENDQVLRGLVERSNRRSYWIGIENTSHSDLTIGPSLSPVAGWFGLRGSMPAAQVFAIVDRYLVSFFERHLLGLGGRDLTEAPPPGVLYEFIP